MLPRLWMALALSGLALNAWGQTTPEAPAPATAPLSRQARARLPRLAILEFKAAPDCWSGWRQGGWGPQMATLSDRLRDLFTTALVEQGAGKVRIIDRERLEDLRKELALQQSGEVDTAPLQKMGKLLGVSYMMTGKITRFACQSAKAGVDLLGTGVKQVSFNGRLDVRLVSVETGEVLEAFHDEGKVEDRSVTFLSAGTEVLYDEELVSQVFEPVVTRLTPRIIGAAARAQADDPAGTAN